jgi:hypothetical protein
VHSLRSSRLRVAAAGGRWCPPVPESSRLRFSSPGFAGVALIGAGAAGIGFGVSALLDSHMLIGVATVGIGIGILGIKDRLWRWQQVLLAERPDGAPSSGHLHASCRYRAGSGGEGVRVVW